MNKVLLSNVYSLKYYSIVRCWMKFTNLILLSFILFFFSCSSTKVIKNIDSNSKLIQEFNYLSETRTGNIVLNSDKVIVTNRISLEENSIDFKCSYCDSVESISPDEVKMIYFQDYISGGAQGALFGAVSGGVITYKAIDDDADMAGYTILSGITGGAIVGAFTGYLIGTKIKYKIQY
jgi:hypothetical protein